MLPAEKPSLFQKHHPRNKFTPEDLLTRVVKQCGQGDWERVASLVPGRNSRQCRDRWLNYLSPDVRNYPWSAQQEILLIQKHKEFGTAWKHIATFFPGRTDTAVKSHWLLMERRARREARQWATLANAILSSERGQRPLGSARDGSSLPLPVGLRAETVASLSSDHDWEDDPRWDFPEASWMRAPKQSSFTLHDGFWG
jgi:hypothetical protein